MNPTVGRIEFSRNSMVAQEAMSALSARIKTNLDLIEKTGRDVERAAVLRFLLMESERYSKISVDTSHALFLIAEQIKEGGHRS